MNLFGANQCLTLTISINFNVEIVATRASMCLVMNKDINLNIAI